MVRRLSGSLASFCCFYRDGSATLRPCHKTWGGLAGVSVARVSATASTGGVCHTGVGRLRGKTARCRHWSQLRGPMRTWDRRARVVSCHGVGFATVERVVGVGRIVQVRNDFSQHRQAEA